MIVGIDGKEPIYERNSLTDFVFTLNISESGTYRIVVIEHNTCGSIAFTKKGSRTVKKLAKMVERLFLKNSKIVLKM